MLTTTCENDICRSAPNSPVGHTQRIQTPNSIVCWCFTIPLNTIPNGCLAYIGHLQPGNRRIGTHTSWPTLVQRLKLLNHIFYTTKCASYHCSYALAILVCQH